MITLVIECILLINIKKWIEFELKILFVDNLVRERERRVRDDHFTRASWQMTSCNFLLASDGFFGKNKKDKIQYVVKSFGVLKDSFYAIQSENLKNQTIETKFAKWRF